MVNNFVDRSEIYWMPNFVIFGGVCIGVTTIQKVGGTNLWGPKLKARRAESGGGVLGRGQNFDFGVFWD